MFSLVLRPVTAALMVAGLMPRARLLASADFILPLKNSIVPEKGPAPTACTRASSAWIKNNEGKVVEVLTDCARFEGARIVRNRVTSPSNILAVSASNTSTFANAGNVTFSMGAGTGTATFSGTGGATGTLAASPTGRVEVTKTITAGTFVVTASVADLVDIQTENVTGQADQTASQYVSVGVLSFPFHGLGADGVKAFTTHKDGTSIPDASLLGYKSEGARVNPVWPCSDMTHANWLKTNVTPALNATDVRGIPNTATTLTATANGATITYPVALSGTRAMSIYLKRSVGTGTIEFTHDGTTWTDVTSSLSTSAFFRVRLENKTVSNPHSIGLRFGTSGDAVIACAAQDEDGPTVSTPIFAQTAPMTRAADSGIVFDRGTVLVDNAGTAYARWSTDANEGTYLINAHVLRSDANGVMLFGGSPANTTQVRAYDGTSLITDIYNVVSRSNTTLRKQISCWSGTIGGPNTGLRTITEGNTDPSNTSAYDGTMGTASTFTVGALGFLNARDVTLWGNRAVTDAQMAELVK